MLRIAERLFDAQLVIFDKDGTLIAFDAMWHSWYAAFLAHIAKQAPFTREFRLGLAATLGYEPDDESWDPEGPLTLASTSEVGLLVASQVYRYLGKTWDESLTMVARAQEQARALLLTDDLVEPVGDVRAAVTRLKEGGLLVALATADTRQPAEAALAKLGIASLLDATICGDDGVALKPAPDMALEICRRLGIDPSQVVMVGDTVADMQMARRAGLGLAVGVTSGANKAEILAPYADCVVSDIHAIEVVCAGGQES
jgi:HAD superfamily hydrolase (TIGR01509 family)